MDAKKTELLEQLVKAKGIVTKACEVLQMPRSTYYLWYNSDPEFKSEADSINDVVLDFAEDKLYKLVDDGDTAATIFLLKTRGKKRGYVEKSEVDLRTPDGVTVLYKQQEGNKPLPDAD
jgi:hypothetical protein